MKSLGAFIGVDTLGHFVFSDGEKRLYMDAFDCLDDAFNEFLERMGDAFIIDMADKYDCAPCRLVEISSMNKRKYMDGILNDRDGYPVYLLEVGVGPFAYDLAFEGNFYDAVDRFL